jgi:heme-degrading monooxygenase HmoA
MFAHLVIHYPKPGHVADLLASMRRVDTAARGIPGLIQIGPWRDQGSDRLIGLALWESQDAYQAAAARIFAVVADDPFGDWCSQPPEVFHLTREA